MEINIAVKLLLTVPLLVLKLSLHKRKWCKFFIQHFFYFYFLPLQFRIAFLSIKCYSYMTISLF